MTARDPPFDAAPKLAADFSGIEKRLPGELAKHFPHVLGKIEALWPDVSVASYLDSLLFADRPDRQGFTPEALGEIFFIKQLHEFLYLRASPAAEGSLADTVTTRLMPASVQELSEWYPARMAVGAIASAGSAAPDVRDAVPDLAPALDGWPRIDSADALRELLQRREPGLPLLPPSKAKLGEILRERGLVSEDQLGRALQMQRASAPTARLLFGQLLVRLGLVTEEDTIRALCVQEGVPLVDLDRIDVQPDVRGAVALELARQHRAVPILRVSTGGSSTTTRVAVPPSSTRSSRRWRSTRCARRRTAPGAKRPRRSPSPWCRRRTPRSSIWSTRW
jgi:hypothetical protein